MEELVDSWNFNFSNDFRFLPHYIHGIIYADAACKFYISTFHVILGGTIKVRIQGLIVTTMNEDVHAHRGALQCYNKWAIFRIPGVLLE